MSPSPALKPPPTSALSLRSSKSNSLFPMLLYIFILAAVAIAAFFAGAKNAKRANAIKDAVKK